MVCEISRRHLKEKNLYNYQNYNIIDIKNRYGENKMKILNNLNNQKRKKSRIRNKTIFSLTLCLMISFSIVVSGISSVVPVDTFSQDITSYKQDSIQIDSFGGSPTTVDIDVSPIKDSYKVDFPITFDGFLNIGQSHHFDECVSERLDVSIDILSSQSDEIILVSEDFGESRDEGFLPISDISTEHTQTELYEIDPSRDIILENPDDGLIFTWDFGDMASSDSVSTEHQYSTPGTYTVKLEITYNNVIYTSNCEIKIIPEDLTGMGKINLLLGERVTLENLFYLSLVNSDNNATLAMVRSTGMSKDEFVSKMNEKAVELHLSHTHFADPVGLKKVFSWR